MAVNRHVKGGRYLPGRVGSYHKAAGDHDEHAEEQDQNLDSDLGGQGIPFAERPCDQIDGQMAVLPVGVGNSQHGHPDEQIAQQLLRVFACFDQ